MKEPTRREMLTASAKVASLLAAAGFLPGLAHAAWPQAAFETKSVADAVKALGGSAPVASGDVTVTGPDIAENGAVVPVGAATTLAGAKRLLLLVEKNPNALAAVFDLTDAVEPNILARVNMAQTSNVYAVAMMADGRALFASKEIKVTLGGCGG
ncbi:MAG: thiosulfate oxidation carrier protein SoxY [Burkholderiaceae bacterium]|nr:thiosulfate oxidation carrier protein SoxY [Burkholderiaceae bacterium]